MREINVWICALVIHDKEVAISEAEGVTLLKQFT